MKIKPCPFCGGKDSSRREASGGGYFRECYHCNAKGPWRADAGEADTVWNHSVTAALTKERDEARRERDCVGENEAFAHEEVERLRKHIVMLTNKLALVESSIRLPKLDPKTEAEIERTISDDLVKERDERIAALEKERDEALFALEQLRENMDKIFVEREQMQARIAAVVAAYDHSALVPMHHAISKLRATLTGGKETK